MNTLITMYVYWCCNTKMAAKAGKELGKEKVVDLNQLSIPELDRLKSQVDQVRR